MSKFGTLGDYPKESLMSATASLLTAWRSLERYHNDLLRNFFLATPKPTIELQRMLPQSEKIYLESEAIRLKA